MRRRAKGGGFADGLVSGLHAALQLVAVLAVLFGVVGLGWVTYDALYGVP